MLAKALAQLPGLGRHPWTTDLRGVATYGSSLMLIVPLAPADMLVT